MNDFHFFEVKFHACVRFCKIQQKSFIFGDFLFLDFTRLHTSFPLFFSLSIGKCVEFEKVFKKVFNTRKCYKCWKPIGFMAFFPSYFAFLRHFVFTYQHFQHSKCWKLDFSTFVHNAQMLTLLLIFKRFTGCLLTGAPNSFLKLKNEFLQDKYIFYHHRNAKKHKNFLHFCKTFFFFSLCAIQKTMPHGKEFLTIHIPPTFSSFNDVEFIHFPLL